MIGFLVDVDFGMHLFTILLNTTYNKIERSQSLLSSSITFLVHKLFVKGEFDSFLQLSIAHVLIVHVVTEEGSLIYTNVTFRK